MGAFDAHGVNVTGGGPGSEEQKCPIFIVEADPTHCDMKNHLTTILVVCAALAAHRSAAQFDALPDSNATWTTSFWIGPGYPYEGYFHEYAPVDPDTIIGGEVFKKLLETNNFGGPYSAGALRDNEEGQVYYCPNSGSPVLLYDFDVLPGDTIQDVMGLWVDDVGVYSVDTIVVNGTERKRIGLECLSSPGFASAYWIQGIGGNGGLLLTNACPSVSGSGTLICMTANDTIQYGLNVGSIGACDIFLGKGNATMNSDPTVYPNPSNGSFMFTSTAAPGSRWKVRDANGRELIDVEGDTIDLRGHAPGIYFAEFSTAYGNHRVPLMLTP